MSKSSLPGNLVQVVSRFLEDLGSPFSLGVKLMLDAGQWDEIVALEPDPRRYLNAADYLKDVAAASLLRKFEPLPTSHDRKAQALSKWYEGEFQCKKANFRLEPYREQSLFKEERQSHVASLVRDIRAVVRELVGNRPSESPEGRLGPGSTFSVRGRHITPPDKMSSSPTLTADSLWVLLEWQHTSWARAIKARNRSELTQVRGNRFTTVPKTAKTDRSIAIEPDLNVFYQLAYGRQLREELLRRAGWDLGVAQEIHRRVACASSITREFATLDLSNASDTLSKTLVEVLLPTSWFSVLDSLRSKCTMMGPSQDPKWILLEKFSSMGNGFTFELETVLFAAISMAVTRKCGGVGQLGHDVFVYGDDIIVPNGVAPVLKPVLEFFGLSLNLSKSFYDDSPFRESCGGDYFNGMAVRPYFLKDELNEPQDYVALANGLSALAEKFTACGSPLSRRSWFSVLDNVPTTVRSCRGPKDLGDIVIHDDPSRWTLRWQDSIRYIRTIKPGKKTRVNLHAFSSEVTLACATYGISSSHPKGWAWHPDGGVIPRDGVSGYKIGWTAYS